MTLKLFLIIFSIALSITVLAVITKRSLGKIGKRKMEKQTDNSCLIKLANKKVYSRRNTPNTVTSQHDPRHSKIHSV